MNNSNMKISKRSKNEFDKHKSPINKRVKNASRLDRTVHNDANSSFKFKKSKFPALSLNHWKLESDRKEKHELDRKSDKDLFSIQDPEIEYCTTEKENKIKDLYSQEVGSISECKNPYFLKRKILS